MFVHFALPDESHEFDRPQGLPVGNFWGKGALYY
jgi:hypothetical protein